MKKLLVIACLAAIALATAVFSIPFVSGPFFAGPSVLPGPSFSFAQKLGKAGAISIHGERPDVPLVFEAERGRVLSRQEDGRVLALAVSPDGQLLVTGDEKGWLRVWDIATGEKRGEARSGQVIQALAFSEDDSRLAVALKDSTIGIVDVAVLQD